MYVTPNFKDKKKHSRLHGTPPVNGSACVEGPHSLESHKWWARVGLRDGRVVWVK